MAVARFGGRSCMAEALVLRRLSKAYVAGKPVLRDIDVEIAAEGITAIIGPSGTGKSTLIRCINRLVEPTSGEILFDGRDLARASGVALRHARRHIGMVFQEYNLVERLTVMENLLSGRLGYVSPWNAWRRRFPAAPAGWLHRPACSRERAVIDRRRAAPCRRAFHRRLRGRARARAAMRGCGASSGRTDCPRNRSWNATAGRPSGRCPRGEVPPRRAR